MAAISIELKGIRIFAGIGVYEHERRAGNEFETDLLVEAIAPENIITHIRDTINYVDIYTMLQDSFRKEYQLLETCAMELAEELHRKFEQVKKVEIAIRKINPPISGFEGSVGVRYSKNFD